MATARRIRDDAVMKPLCRREAQSAASSSRLRDARRAIAALYHRFNNHVAVSGHVVPH